MSSHRASYVDDDGSIYLYQLWGDVWRKRWLVIAICTLAAVTSAGIALLLPSWYRADVLLAPVDKKNSLGALSQLSGLAGLAGISVGDGDSAEAVAILKSRDMTRDFIQEHDLMPVLYADVWDGKLRRWKESDPELQPDLRDAIRYFDRRVRGVEEDRRTKLVKLSIEWKDPKLAAEWANLLADRLNKVMRDRALRDAETNVEYLKAQLQSEPTLELHQSISRLLEAEMEKVMLAQGNKDFSFRIIDRAQVPKRRSSPQRVLIVLAGTFVAGAMAVVLIALGALRKRQRGLIESSKERARAA